MNDYYKLAKDLQEEKNKNHSDGELGRLSAIYLFVSFDLVNSTLFKSRHVDIWPQFISSFYEAVMKEFAVGRYENSRSIADENDEIQRTGGFRLWKLVGDEVLLFHKVLSKSELYKVIAHINKKRKELIEESIKGYIETSEANASDSRHLLHQYFEVKTTVWIGSCTDTKQKVTTEYPNLIYDSGTFSNENAEYDGQFDFLGPDIDEGFRLCEYAEKRQMIVSPKLVFLLLMSYKDDIDKVNVLNLNFKIVNYVTMKGVWENRLYPIIMFCQCDLDQGSALKQWKSMFEYDAFENSLLYANIEKNGENFLQDSKFSIHNLYNIYKDIVREDEMQAMLKTFENQERDLKNVEVDQHWKKKRKFEFHISCLCYHGEKYWITEHKNHGWSFGCTQIVRNVEYYNYVIQAYKNKYGLEIELSDENDILSFYSVDRNGVTEDSILGIAILVTKVRDIREEVTPQEMGQWYSYEEAKMLPGKKIEKFDLILDRANEILKKKEVVFSME